MSFDILLSLLSWSANHLCTTEERLPCCLIWIPDTWLLKILFYSELAKGKKTCLKDSQNLTDVLFDWFWHLWNANTGLPCLVQLYQQRCVLPGAAVSTEVPSPTNRIGSQEHKEKGNCASPETTLCFHSQKTTRAWHC